MRQAQTQVRVTGIHGIAQRRTKIVHFGLEPLDSDSLRIPGQQRLDLGSQPQEIVSVTTRGFLSLCGGHQLLQAVLPDDLEHSVAGFADVDGTVQQASRHEHVDTIQGGHLRQVGYRGRGVECEAALEDGNATEQSLVFGIQ